MDSEQLSHEINIKAINALSNIMDDERRGIITRAQAKTAVRAIYDTVGGLVPTDTFDLISQAAEEYKQAHGTEVQWFRVGSDIKGICRIAGTGKVLRIDRATPQRIPSNNTDIDDDAAAKDHAAKLFAKLKDEVQW